MRLTNCLEIAKDCGLETVGEGILNIRMHAMSLFPYSEINKEMQELKDEVLELYKFTNFTSTSKVQDVLDWYILQEIERIESLEKSLKDGMIYDADTVLADLVGMCEFEVSGISKELFDIYKNSSDKESIEKLFELFTDTGFKEYLNICEKEIKSNNAKCEILEEAVNIEKEYANEE